MTTLKREDTPYQGMYPAILPQHFDAGSTSTLLTGKDNPLPTYSQGSNALIGKYTLTWSGSAGAGTTQSTNVTLPAQLQKDALYLVSVQNPSSLGTSVTVTLNNMIDFGAGPIAANVTSVSVPSGTTKSYLVQGWLMGDAAAQIVASNDSSVSSNGGSIYIQVRAV